MVCGLVQLLMSTLSRQARLGGGRYDNDYSELGKLIHNIKYEKYLSDEKKEYLLDWELMPKIKPFLDEMKFFVEKYLIVCPMPPTEYRDYQFVFSLARKIAEYKGKKYYERLLQKKSDQKAKNLPEGEEFSDGAFTAWRLKFPSSVLIIDDTYGRGRSLRACIRVLRSDKNVKNIYFISVVKNRSKGLL